VTVKVALAGGVLAALIAVPAAGADGFLSVFQNGTGVVRGTTRYLAVENAGSEGTQLLAISTKDGTLEGQVGLVGNWGLPGTPAGAEGLSADGHTLLLEDTTDGATPTSLFMVVRPRPMELVKEVTLNGYFAYDALSPDGSRLYLIEYQKADGTVDLSRYIVRAYDLKHNRLLPGRIADRTQKSWVMQGTATTRTTSSDGRWVYTLYANPGGYPFVHALDTVRGVAHCVGIPLTDQAGISNIVLALHGTTLSVHWRSGRPFVNVNTTTWQVTSAHRSFPWLWLIVGVSLFACGSITSLWLVRARWVPASRRWSRRRGAASRSTTPPTAPSSVA